MMSLLRKQSSRFTRRSTIVDLEPLERRELLAAVSVNATQVIRSVDTQLLGVNLAWWDSDLNTQQTRQMVQAAGLTMFRFPGGSSSDDFHFNSPPSYQGQGTDSSMASFIAAAGSGSQALVTLDYGSGSPQEAAALLAYLNASVGNTTQIGNGLEWNDSQGSWQTVNWQNAGYWASLRAAAPLAHDDGLNFLRLDQYTPFAFHDFEVGNEEYGSWETDHHNAPHDPATYVAFAKQFATYAAQIDPSISIGVDTGSPGTDFNNWIADVLAQSVAQGFTPGFLSDHNYVQAPGSESDSTLLLDTVSQPSSGYGWSSRAAGYENLLMQYLGAAGNHVELLATEFNSVYANPGKQTTSLVNGLFVADSLGVLLETPYDGADVWDLRNGWDTSNNNASTLYGWRQGGDYGLLGSPNGSPPSSGAYVPYPTYFAEQLASKIIQPGGLVVQVGSNDPNLAAYGVLESSGHVDLLVINKNGSSTLTGQFQIANFQPSAQAQVWQYGQAQDTAQSQTTDGHSALANFGTTLGLSGSSFSFAFPAYSMTVLDLSPVSGNPGSPPSISSPASAVPNPVRGTTTTVSVSATDTAGAGTLTYTWTTIGTPPALVRFSTNGTSAARSTTATFRMAGSYTFQVTVADPSGLTATSRVTVEVDPVATTIMVSPASLAATVGSTQQFMATVLDQFGESLATQPELTWSVTSGGGTIDPTGRYTATAVGTAQVQAAYGSVHGSATVTVTGLVTTPPPTSGPRVTIRYTHTRSRQAGFVGDITITNTGAASLNGWTLQFTLTTGIASIANATIIRHKGTRYTIQNISTDATIAPGQTVGISLSRPRGRSFGAPSKYVFDGTALGGKG
jgi:hypothetical protein